jgi:hypothetical protein
MCLRQTLRRYTIQYRSMYLQSLSFDLLLQQLLNRLDQVRAMDMEAVNNSHNSQANQRLVLEPELVELPMLRETLCIQHLATSSTTALPRWACSLAAPPLWRDKNTSSRTSAELSACNS